MLTGSVPSVLRISGNGAKLGDDGALVVGGAAAEEPAIAAGQVPGVALPLLAEKLIGWTS